MHRFKKIYLVFLLGVAFLALAECKRNGLANEDILERSRSTNGIIWGVKYDTRLLGMMDIENRTIQGFDVDVVEATTGKILGENGKAEFVEVTSRARIPLLKDGNIDAIIATMTITDERKKQVDSSDAYFDVGQALLVKKGSQIKSVDDLDASTTVLAIKSSTSAANIRQYAPGTNILGLENYTEAFTALQSGQRDAMTTDSAILLGIADKSPEYELVGGTFTNEPYGITINRGQENFLKAVNQALEEMYADGTYGKIYQKWSPNEIEGKVE